MLLHEQLKQSHGGYIILIHIPKRPSRQRDTMMHEQYVQVLRLLATLNQNCDILKASWWILMKCFSRNSLFGWKPIYELYEKWHILAFTKRAYEWQFVRQPIQTYIELQLLPNLACAGSFLMNRFIYLYFYLLWYSQVPWGTAECDLSVGYRQSSEIRIAISSKYSELAQLNGEGRLMLE